MLLGGKQLLCASGMKLTTLKLTHLLEIIIFHLKYSMELSNMHKEI